MVQKVTFEIVACGLESPVKPAAGCCFPVSEGLQQAPPTFISMVEKVTFDIVACGLEGPVKPSCCKRSETGKQHPAEGFTGPSRPQATMSNVTF